MSVGPAAASRLREPPLTIAADRVPGSRLSRRSSRSAQTSMCLCPSPGASLRMDRPGYLSNRRLFTFVAR
jgi:hypothetical protein